MKHTRLLEFLFTLLPLMSLVVAFGIVFHQYNRRDGMKKELEEDRREYARLQKRYSELRHQELSAGGKTPDEAKKPPLLTRLPVQGK